MIRHEQNMLYPLYNIVRGRQTCDVVDMLWRRGMLNRAAVERCYFKREVMLRLQDGRAKTKKVAMMDVARISGCSYEKVRAAVYEKRNNQKATDKEWIQRLKSPTRRNSV